MDIPLPDSKLLPACQTSRHYKRSKVQAELKQSIGYILEGIISDDC